MTDDKYEELMSMPASDMVDYVMTGMWFDTEYPDECMGCEE